MLLWWAKWHIGLLYYIVSQYLYRNEKNNRFMNNIETFGIWWGGGWRHYWNAPCTLVIIYLAGGWGGWVGFFFMCGGGGGGWVIMIMSHLHKRDILHFKINMQGKQLLSYIFLYINSLMCEKLIFKSYVRHPIDLLQFSPFYEFYKCILLSINYDI